MYPSALIDLHCDTLTAFMAPHRCPDTLDDPQAAFSLSSLPDGIHWCQCFAIFVPDGLSQPEAVAYYRRYANSFRQQMDRFSSRVSPCRTAGDIQDAWSAKKTALVPCGGQGRFFIPKQGRWQRPLHHPPKQFSAHRPILWR